MTTALLPLSEYTTAKMTPDNSNVVIVYSDGSVSLGLPALKSLYSHVDNEPFEVFLTGDRSLRKVEVRWIDNSDWSEDAYRSSCYGIYEVGAPPWEPLLTFTIFEDGRS